MVEQTPVDTVVVEYREPADRDGQPGALVGACVTDRHADGLSMVYSFYNADDDGRSLGTFMVLDHIEQARSRGLPYVYLGYWIEGSRKMAYKARFAPLEGRREAGWVPLQRP
jgi:arginine-tRNA-protein transferase